MSRPKVTVIVPVFNTRERYLKKCISSITEQTLKNIEIIIVDDGSGKDTFEAVEAAAGTDDRIRAVHKENGGVSSARNTGLDTAEGEYICFMDSDDWMDKDCLETAYRTAVRKKADMVGWRFCREYEKKREDIRIFHGDGLVYSVERNRTIQEFPIYDMRIMGDTTMKLYKRELFEGRRYREELTNGEDTELNFRLYTEIRYAVYIDRPFYHYRFVADSAVRGYNEDFLNRYNQTLRAIKEDIKEVLNTEMKEELKSAFLDFTAISYLMLCMHYVFSPKNKRGYRDKVQELKMISGTVPYSEAIAEAGNLAIPLTRKMALICAKHNFYFGVMCIVKVKFLLYKLYG